MADMVYPGRGRPRARPYREHDARAVRIALNALRLAIQTAQGQLAQYPEVAKYLSVMRPFAFDGVTQDYQAIYEAAGDLCEALHSDGDPPAGGS